MDYINSKLVEFNNYLKGRSVALIGLGISNTPLIDYLHNVAANITVFDKKYINYIDKNVIDKIIEYGIEYYFGDDYLDELDEFDIIFRSPSCLPTEPDLIREAKRGAIITTEIEMFMELCPCKIIGVTGSDGKTTTASLIYEILKKAGYNCYIGGNIGIPLFNKIYEIKPDDIVVLELSSYQLMGMKISPNISVITNISEEHMKLHSSFDEYITSIKNIFINQSKNDMAIINCNSDIAKEITNDFAGDVTFFSSNSTKSSRYIIEDGIIKVNENGIKKHVFDTKKMVMRGIHNFENATAALLATKKLVPLDIQSQVINSFEGIAHRLEIVKETPNSQIWYNDSASEFPNRTIASLKAFPNRDIILIAGGYDKKFDYDKLGKEIVKNCRVAILLSQTGERIEKSTRKALVGSKKDLEIKRCSTLYEAVSIANKLSKRGDIILFSPASSSLDSFDNYEERGEIYKGLVNEIV